MTVPMSGAWQDVRYAARRLARTPGATVAAALSLAIGLGAGTTVFSIANSLLLTPLPVERPGELVAVYTSEHSGEAWGFSSHPDYLDFAQRATGLRALVAYTPQPLNLSTGGEAELVAGEAVSGNYFGVLGVPVALGRPLHPDDDRPGAPAVAVIGEALHRRRFGGDPAVVGRPIVLGGETVTVVGVARAAFTGLVRGLPAEVFIPVSLRSRYRATDPLGNRGARHLLLLGRLAPGASAEVVGAQLAVAAAALQGSHPQQWTDAAGRRRRVTVIPEWQARVMPAAREAVLGVSALLAVVAGFVLFLSCANVATLMLARTAERRREVAVRLSLGATRWRLVRPFLAESLLVAALGGVVGVVLAFWSADLISAFRAPASLPFQLAIAVDARVILFASVLVAATGVAVGLVPALSASRPALVDDLRDGGGPAGTPRGRAQRVFVVAQVAVSVVLLACGGLFLRSLANASAIDPGFRIKDAAMISYDLSTGGYSAARGRAFHDRVAERVAAIPGVESVALGAALPLSLDWQRRGVWIEGAAETEDREQAIGFAGPGFFETLGIELVRGRGFTRADGEGAPLVAVVNESFAARSWPGQDALGRRISVSGPEGPWLEVVGITRDGKYFTLGEAPRPHFYLPLQQHYRAAPTVIARTTGDPHAVLPALRAAVQELDRGLAVTGVQTLGDHLGVSLAPTRAAGAIAGAFGALGVALACIGLHALLAHAVRARTREIGVRLALGAQPAAVARLVLRDGLGLVAAGLLAGVPVAVGLAGLIRGMLYGLSPADPVTFAAVIAVLLAVAALAIAPPARRASRVDPLRALRHCERARSHGSAHRPAGRREDPTPRRGRPDLGAAPHRPRRRRGRLRLDHGPVGRGQVHAAAHPRHARQRLGAASTCLDGRPCTSSRARSGSSCRSARSASSSRATTCWTTSPSPRTSTCRCPTATCAKAERAGAGGRHARPLPASWARRTSTPPSSRAGSSSSWAWRAR